MNPNLPSIRKPRCFLVYALAPESLLAAEANRLLNFIGARGGVVVFFVETEAQRQALLEPGELEGWQVAIHPLIFSYSPSAFDEQIAFTLRRYRGADWETLRYERRPSYGNPRREAETAQEDT